MLHPRARHCLLARLALCVCLSLCERCGLAGVAGQVVTVAEGQLRGEWTAGVGGARDYLAFRGVRYAAPPVADLRYRAPRPAPHWLGVADATAEGDLCPQVKDGEVVGSEDCLYLNVYTPTLDCPAGGYAVIVFFHGGSLIEGSAGARPYFGPDFLVHHDVVLVMPNYRVGALGFLNLDSQAVPGNAGIKDALAALRWVRDNAAAFCGDPGRVTAMGQSAGSKLLAYAGLAEGSRGLFRAAIHMSGTANSAMAYTERHIYHARALAARLANNGTSPSDRSDMASVERTLVNASWEDITRQAYDMYKNPGWGLFSNPFVPSPEGRPAHDGEEFALIQDPESLLRDPVVPRVPTLTGVVTGEGIAFTHTVLKNPDYMADLVANFTDWLRADFAYVGAATAGRHGVATEPCRRLLDEIARRVRDKYFDGQDPSTEYPEALTHLVGDVRYVYPLFRWIRHLDDQTAPMYLYLFDQVTSFNFMIPIDSHVAGAAHADDLAYSFRVTLKELHQDLDGPGRGNQTLREHIRLITDFAKNLTDDAIVDNDVARLQGQASDRKQRAPYLYIGKTFRETRIENFLGAEDRMAFWDEIMDLMLDPLQSSSSTSQLGPAGAVAVWLVALVLGLGTWPRSASLLTKQRC